MTDTLIIKDAVKRYPNGALAVKGVNVSVGDGELVVFVGPSGCGKSTLLRMVAGLEAVTEGEISLGGRVVNDIEPADRNIAMVFQNYALYPHMSVRNNLAYGLKNRKMPKDEIARKVAEAAKMLQIEEYLDRKPGQLSGGQRQRVAMGRAIVRDPAIFLFDEPLSNLDAKLRTQMRLEIKKLQRRLGVASIYVTHDQVEAMTLADRIVVLNLGEVEQIGTPAEVYGDPASTFVASFIGAPPMNLLPGKVDNGHVHLGDSALPSPNGLPQGPVTIGLRPERVVIGNDGIPFNIEAIEELGATRLIHGSIGGADLVATVEAGQEIPAEAHISADPADLKYFDADHGRRIA
ncbi:MAG: sn-glycerol-3-phosphate ABC transporter ATP-binding protein UgpC [Pseudomonadota bacterium]